MLLKALRKRMSVKNVIRDEVGAVECDVCLFGWLKVCHWAYGWVCDVTAVGRLLGYQDGAYCANPLNCCDVEKHEPLMQVYFDFDDCLNGEAE